MVSCRPHRSSSLSLIKRKEGLKFEAPRKLRTPNFVRETKKTKEILKQQRSIHYIEYSMLCMQSVPGLFKLYPLHTTCNSGPTSSFTRYQSGFNHDAMQYATYCSQLSLCTFKAQNTKMI
jgi:hypothetical protein